MQCGLGLEAAGNEAADLDGAPADAGFGEERSAFDLVRPDRDRAVGPAERDSGDMRLAGGRAYPAELVRFDCDLAGAAQRDAGVVPLALIGRADALDGVAGDPPGSDAVAEHTEPGVAGERDFLDHVVVDGEPTHGRVGGDGDAGRAAAADQIALDEQALHRRLDPDAAFGEIGDAIADDLGLLRQFRHEAGQDADAVAGLGPAGDLVVLNTREGARDLQRIEDAAHERVAVDGGGDRGQLDPGHHRARVESEHEIPSEACGREV